MSQPLRLLADGFRLNDQVMEMVTKDFDAADWFRRPEAGGNHAVWLLGHLAGSRRYLLRLVGVELEPPSWLDMFRIGGELAADDAYPAPAELLGDLKMVGAQLADRLAALSPQETEAELEQAMPNGSKTRAGAAHFLYWHETYHLGQLGYIRRMCGRPGFA